jgi:glycosyltransferase involved in cell wall biosynthesis
MDNVAVFLSHYALGNSPSILNLLDFLSQRFSVTLFLQQVALTDVALLKRQSIRVLFLGKRHSLSFWAARARALFSPFRHYIAFDPHGFCLCKTLYPRVRPIYYSLELYLEDDHLGLTYPPEIMRQERRQIGSIAGLIIQSPEKEELFRADYGLPERIPCLNLPVTYRGPSVAEKSAFLRQKYSIPNDQRIALHLGGIREWFSCIELAETFGQLDHWALVFHGYTDSKYEDKLRAVLREKDIRNVFIHDKRFKDLRAVDEIVKSCDLGIAWYNDISIGFRTAGSSSGKIPAYLRFGLPVIAKRYHSTVEALEQPGCGLCVETHGEIPNALGRIVEQYEDYSRAAREQYEARYRFEQYEEEILKFIETTAC